MSDGEEFNAQAYKSNMDQTLETLQKAFADIKTSRTDPSMFTSLDMSIFDS